MLKLIRELPRAVFREQAPKLSPVATAIQNLKLIESRVKLLPYEDAMITYLEIIRQQGHFNRATLLSCQDLALTRHPYFHDDREKEELWEKSRDEALVINRPPRTIQCKLHPIFFHLISSSEKTIEGRAHKPSSSKNYPDIRGGDILHFTLDPEAPDFIKNCRRFKLNATDQMRAQVVDLHFAPTVHGVFSQLNSTGHPFQPQINTMPVVQEILQAAEYYKIYPGGFPHGFIGIELK